MPDEPSLDKLRRGIPIEGRTTAPSEIRPRLGVRTRRTRARQDASERRRLEAGDARRRARAVPLCSRSDREATNASWWVVRLAEGRTRQIREMFLRIGHPVQKLRRVAIGPVRDARLPVGAWRELTEDEVRRLRETTAVSAGEAPDSAAAAGRSPSRVIAIDGPSGVGKSTVARLLAARFGIAYLDSGALYRAAALKVVRAGIDPDDAGRWIVCSQTTRIEVSVAQGAAIVVRLDGEAVSDELRSAAVTRTASRIAAQPAVRRRLTAVQRAAVPPSGAVVEGRDIGSVVFPDTPHKFFLDARLEVRGSATPARRAALAAERGARRSGGRHRRARSARQRAVALAADASTTRTA